MEIFTSSETSDVAKGLNFSSSLLPVVRVIAINPPFKDGNGWLLIFTSTETIVPNVMSSHAKMDVEELKFPNSYIFALTDVVDLKYF